MTQPPSEPEWDSRNYHKHVCSSKKRWDRSFTKATTQEVGQPSQYNPHISMARVREMEMGCWCGEGTIIRDSPRKTSYYRCMCEWIGASSGELTKYIYVEWCKSGGGTLHGHPVTWQELVDKKGVRE